ncbi:MAG TPA: hypothetical protein VMW17_06335 [Candidatus Binatia bacterium]|nr:hypothetical protein [Candidatus Binatia bacterium]
MIDIPARFLLVGLRVDTAPALEVLEVVHGATDGPMSLPLTTLAPSAPQADRILLFAPPTGGASVLTALEWCHQRLASDGTLYASTDMLAEATSSDCFPVPSAEITLGAAGLVSATIDAHDAATSLQQIPAPVLRQWAQALHIATSDLECSRFTAARRDHALSFVSPSINDDTLQANLLRSHAVQSPRNELLVERHGPRVQEALNAGIARATNDLIVVVHEDVYLPPLWEGMFRRSLRLVEGNDPEWGVVGCAGVRRKFGLLRIRRRGVGHARENASTWGQPIDQPEPVDTLDEFLIAFRRSRGLRFDEEQPNYHFYAVDLCLQATQARRRSYAIEAFCYHNSRLRQDRREPPLPDFLAGCDYMRRKWRDHLPILTTCTIIAADPSRDHHARRIRRAARRARTQRMGGR